MPLAWTLLSLTLLAAPSPAPPRPVLVALVLDTSGSLSAPDVARRRKLADAVLQSLPPGSEAALYSFDDHSRLVVPRTRDKDAILAAVDALATAGRYTALNDALFDSSRYLDRQPGTRPRAVLLITDGRDENSALTLEDGLGTARERNIPVFTVGVGRVRTRVLRRIAKLTGGEYFDGARVEGRAITEAILSLAPERTETAPQPASSPAPAPGGAPRPTAPPSTSPTRSRLPLALGLGGAVLVILGIGGFVLWSRRSPSRVEAPIEREEEEEGPATLVTRAPAVEDPRSTMVLRLKPLLHVTRGPDAGRFFEMSLETAISVGRAPGNDVVLRDPAVSSQHFRIRPVQQERRSGQAGTFEVLDLGSTNGTWVNERRVSKQTLTAGDLIKAGESLMQFRMDHMKSA